MSKTLNKTAYESPILLPPIWEAFCIGKMRIRWVREPPIRYPKWNFGIHSALLLISNNFYCKTATIEGEIAVSLATGIVNVNVYNAGTKEVYASYYDREYGNCEFLKSIYIKIENKLKELGVEEI